MIKNLSDYKYPDFAENKQEITQQPFVLVLSKFILI